MVTGIAVIVGSTHVLPHSGLVGQYLSQLSYHFKIRARKALGFHSYSWCIFAFQEVWWFVLGVYLNYLHLTFPIPHLVTV